MVDLDPAAPSFYRRLDASTFLPTVHVQGAWRDDEQHMAPVSGLVAHAVDLHEPREDLQVARISFDILGMMPLAPTSVTVRTVRPGRTIELVEATATIAGRECVRALVWRLSVQDTSDVAGVELEPMPPARPEDLPVWVGSERWGGGYIRGVEMRRDPSTRPGNGRVWIRSPYALVDGETASPVADLVRLVDTANGIAVREDPKDWAYPNIDLTIHLFRAPVRGWLGLDNRVSFGDTGVGLTSTTLSDATGPFGRAEQILTVRRQQ